MQGVAQPDVTQFPPVADDDDGQFDTHEESVLLGSEQIHPPFSQDEEDEEHARQVSSWKSLPWWKRPSPYWVLFGVPLASIGYSALLAPKVALYTTLACRFQSPDYGTDDRPTSFPLANNFTITNGNETVVEAVSVYLPPNSTDASSLFYTLNDPDFQQRCAADPFVQATVATLSAVFTTTTGILVCLTTGWWSSLSDRYGRRTVIFASMFGLFMTDVTHLITAWFVDVLPGGYWFPLFGFFIEGLCGGTSAGAAVINAYLADTTDESTRSRFFSLLQGISFTGVAIGPVVGGLLIHSTGNILSAFYFALILHGIYVTFILSLLPESLTRARAQGTRLRRNQEKENQVSSHYVVGALKGSVRFLSPLAILLPERSSNANPLKHGRRKWSLLFIATAYALVMSVIGSVPYRFQYVEAQFHWTPEIASYYVSSIGVGHAIYLTVILPLIIKYLKPAPVQLPSAPNELPPDADNVSSSCDTSSPQRTAQINPKKHLPASHSAAFDLALARVSLIWSTASSVVVVAANTGLAYILATIPGALGAGFSPAVHALALDIYATRGSGNRGEVGKLYGTLSVVQALSYVFPFASLGDQPHDFWLTMHFTALVVVSQIISPGLYGLVYSNTVATSPRAFLVVTTCTDLLALVFLLFVRASRSANDGNDGDQRVETPENLEVIEEEFVEER